MVGTFVSYARVEVTLYYQMATFPENCRSFFCPYVLYKLLLAILFMNR